MIYYKVKTQKTIDYLVKYPFDECVDEYKIVSDLRQELGMSGISSMNVKAEERSGDYMFYMVSVVSVIEHLQNCS